MSTAAPAPTPAPAPSVSLASYAVLIGVDWAKSRHDLAWREAGQAIVHGATLAASPEAVAAWCQQLVARYGDRPVAICVEQGATAFCRQVQAYPTLELYLANTTVTAHYRLAFHPGGAKNDKRDGRILLNVLEKHHDQLARPVVRSPAIEELAALTEYRRQVVDQRTKAVERLHALLAEYFPQAVELVGGDLTSALAVAFLLRWPDLTSLQQTPVAEIRKFYVVHHCRRKQVLAERLQTIAAAVPVTGDPSVLIPSGIRVRGLAQEIAAHNQTIAAFEQRIAAVARSCPDYPLFHSFPGAGPTLAPRLLAAFGDDRTVWPDAATVQVVSGIAPVQQQSGQHEAIRCRRRCPKFRRQTFHEYAGSSLLYCPWARAFYAYHRATDKNAQHHAIVRALAYKWIRILYACWRDQTPYDEARYLESLRRANSPLLAYLEQPVENFSKNA